MARSQAQIHLEKQCGMAGSQPGPWLWQCPRSHLFSTPLMLLLCRACWSFDGHVTVCLSMSGSCPVLHYVMQCPFKSICSEFKLKIFCELPTPLPLVHDHWLLHCWTGGVPTINFSAWKSSTPSACYHWESPTTPILTCGRKCLFIGSVFADKTELWP